jgi:hypothetical protein
MKRVSLFVAVVSLGAALSTARAGDAVDHSTFDGLLKKYVDAKGLVDYKTWKEKDQKPLDEYLAKLGGVDASKLERSEQIAFWCNAYNAITIRSTIELYPVGSIKDKFWKTNKWNVGGRKDLSLDDIEHKILRPMKEPRIHFAIVCASLGCPYLRPEAYTGAKLDAQLDEQVEKCFSDPAKLKIEREKKVVRAIKLFDWFGDDFGASDAQRLTWIAKHVKDPADKKVCLDSDTSLKFLDWDWSINEKK